MDPNTTLITFMLPQVAQSAFQTHPSVQTVHLVGSWDNFSKGYPMDRDVRRDRGQWRGCYAFKDIICDDESCQTNKRDGGLKMGSTYYYYYELDGCHETHDPTLPTTSNCPYLPGQPVNTLYVPMERTLRKRSASLSSMRNGDFMTMNPDDKFVTPRPAPPVPGATGARLNTSPEPPSHTPSLRSLSPTPTWRRLFCRKSSSSLGRGRRHGRDSVSSETDDARSITSESSRSRDISPESLRRFLSDDITPSVSCPAEDKPAVLIPEEIAEENEDDDNFATSATAETASYPTLLSPPPYKRADSSHSLEAQGASDTPLVHEQRHSTREHVDEHAAMPRLEFVPLKSRFSFSSISSYASSMNHAAKDPPTYDEDDEDDSLSTDGDMFFQPLSPSCARNQSREQAAAPITSYSLPQSSNDGAKSGLSVPTSYSSPGSPALLARHDSGIPIGNTSLLAAPIDTGLGDLVAELGWVADAIRDKSS